MLRTDSSKKPATLPTWALLLLAFLTLAFCFHFLFEDLSFSTTVTLSVSSYSAQSEITHQDDIVQFPELPSHIASNPITNINPVLLPTQIEVFFPLFTPPNI